MKKVSLYCRVSSDDQKERDTIENQVEILRTYIEMKDDLLLYNEYLDNGISGTIPFDQRPSGKQLLQDASNGLFDTVLVWKVDRFGRDTLSGLNAVELLRKYEIEILSVTEPFDLNTPTGRFQFITYLNMAELERNNILDRMYLGATRAAKKGKWMGGIVPYGYTVNKEGFLEININESEIIQLIFKLYTHEHLSTIDIAIYLNNLNIPTSCSTGKGKRTKNITNKWRSGSIQRIINNTTYKGVHLFGKRGSRRKELIERTVPAIISEDIWDLAQNIKKDNFIISKRNNNKRKYLLRGLIKCEYCGHIYYGVSYKNRSDFYVCGGKRGENKRVLGVSCDSINLNADKIEDDVWDSCLDILNNYDYYINKLRTEHANYNNNEDLRALQQAYIGKQNEKNNILTLFRKNIISESDVERQLHEIKVEEERLTNLIKILEQRKIKYDHEDTLVNNISSKMKYYKNKIENLSFEEKYDIVRLLIKGISASNVIEDGLIKPKLVIIYNLVKFDNCTDMDSSKPQA